MRREEAHDEDAALGDNQHDRDHGHHEGQDDEARHENHRWQRDSVACALLTDVSLGCERSNPGKLGDSLRTGRVGGPRGTAIPGRRDE